MPLLLSRTRPQRPALTLLEMLAATVLTALLFAVLTSLLRSFSDQQRVFDRSSARQPPVQLLAEQLRRDLINAQYIQYGPAGLRIVGTIAQDWTTRLPTGRRAEVSYHVAKVGDENWLLRREVHLDDASTQRSREEPVWFGAASIDLIAFDSKIVDDSQGPPQAPIAGMQPVPNQIVVIVRRPDGGQLLNLRILHHWEDI